MRHRLAASPYTAVPASRIKPHRVHARPPAFFFLEPAEDRATASLASARTTPPRLLSRIGRMGTVGGGVGASARRPRFLCLHGFRTSGEIMRTQMMGKWPAEVTERLDLVFPDALFPAAGKSEVEGIFDPPYYEWFQYNKTFTEYTNLDKCFEYVEELMIKEGPFDGLMGFSQGSLLSAALVGLQGQGLALTRVPKIKFLMIISGARLRSQAMAEVPYANKIKTTSLHFLGDNDFLKDQGEKLIEAFVEPFIIRHPKGHTIPRLVDEKSLEVMSRFLDKMENEISEHSSTVAKAPADVDETEMCI